jgi:hypothetical protein
MARELQPPSGLEPADEGVGAEVPEFAAFGDGPGQFAVLVPGSCPHFAK